MRKQPNKYRNQLGPTATSYMVLIGLIAAITGSAFVYLRNQHLAQEDRKRDLEQEIAKLEDESGQLHQKIQLQLNQSNLYQALLQSGSDLVDKIPAGAVTTIAAVPLPGEGGNSSFNDQIEEE
ncbi:MAG: hypothetical protein KDN22_18745 [Verrucomicrobiae bacterium]|nr:hypothetical protein [Verrucomicrobiae bacterium]